MNPAGAAIRRSTFVLFCCVVLMIAGLIGYARLGKLEDPTYTVKTALVVTPYPGATAWEVEEEVSDRIENAVQKMGQLDRVRSRSMAGLSVVYAEMHEHFEAHEFPQIWDELRRKVGDMQHELPPGAGPSLVQDDFGEVYGVLLAIVGDGFDYAELYEYVKELRDELLKVRDVSRVKIWGEQQEVVYLESSRARLTQAGIAPQVIAATVTDQNRVRDAGTATAPGRRMPVRPGGEFHKLEEISALMLRGADGQLVRLEDIATVRRGYQEPPEKLMRFDGRPALGLAISTVEGGNAVRMGEAVARRLEELKASMPIGIEIGTVAYQSETVREAVAGFLRNLGAAVAIVLVTLLLFLGWRSGVVIGTTLLLTILGTLVFMRFWGIDLQRVSLGAMIIALGMLVDNAIVVTDGIVVRRQRGKRPVEAAEETVRQTAWPLLGATLVAIFAFLAIYLSPNNTGEYTRSLFEVLADSLLISWVLAMTVTPVLCHHLLLIEKGGDDHNPYDSRLHRLYEKSLLRTLTNHRIALWSMGVLAVAGLVGIFMLRQDFFPPSTRDQFLLDYWLPEGSGIHAVAKDLEWIEERLLEDARVKSTATFIGGGPPRFNLLVEPEFPSENYGQAVVTVHDYRDIDGMLEELREELAEAFPHAEPRLRPFPLGPASRFEIEARFHGPDPEVLRSLGEEAKEILRAHPYAHAVRDNWRQPVMNIVPRFDQARARPAIVDRTDLADSLKGSFDGLQAGLYREGDLLLPILMRLPEEERRRLDDIGQLRVWSRTTGRSFPLIQVTSAVDIDWEDPLVWRQDRQRTLTVEADARVLNARELHSRVRGDIEAIPLPTGYTLSWGGTHENTVEALRGLFGGIPVSLLLMVLIVVGLFNAVRQPLIVFVILPLAGVGVALGLLVTGKPLGFMAMLGTLSLSGMMIKNSVVLLDETDRRIATTRHRFSAVTGAALSRMRPVLMAVMTTVLGMIPLVFDPFFDAMAVAIMSGLFVATLLTLYVVPLLYTVLFRIGPDEVEQEPDGEPDGDP